MEAPHDPTGGSSRDQEGAPVEPEHGADQSNIVKTQKIKCHWNYSSQK